MSSYLFTHTYRYPYFNIMALSKDEINKYFHLPVVQDAKELKVGLNVLKRRCRDLGIKRWPQRKLSGLNLLITNLQDRLHMKLNYMFMV